VIGTLQKERLRSFAETDWSALRRMVRASSERVDRVQRAKVLPKVAGEVFTAPLDQGSNAVYPGR